MAKREQNVKTTPRGSYTPPKRPGNGRHTSDRPTAGILEAFYTKKDSDGDKAKLGAGQIKKAKPASAATRQGKPSDEHVAVGHQRPPGAKEQKVLKQFAFGYTGASIDQRPHATSKRLARPINVPPTGTPYFISHSGAGYDQHATAA